MGAVAGPTVLLALAVLLGALIQGSVGFGFPLLVVPIMAVVRPEAVPAMVLLLSLPMATLMALREQRSIDLPGFARITTGRLVGTFCGVGVLVAVPARILLALLGSLLIVAAMGSFFVPNLKPTARTQFLTGIASGIMGTVGALGGTPLALLYRGRPGPELRSTLALSFVFGIAMSLAGLAIAGKVNGQHVILTLQLLPGLLLGLWISRHTARLLDGRWLQPALSSVAAATGAFMVFTSL